MFLRVFFATETGNDPSFFLRRRKIFREKSTERKITQFIFGHGAKNQNFLMKLSWSLMNDEGKLDRLSWKANN